MRLDSKFYQIAITSIFAVILISFGWVLFTVLFLTELKLSDVILVATIFSLLLILSRMIDKKSVRMLQDIDQFTFKSLIRNKPITTVRKHEFILIDSGSNTRIFGFTFIFTYKVELKVGGINKTFYVTSNVDLIKYLQSCNF